MNDRKLIGEWKGKLTIYGTLKESKIQIFKVKNQKNKIVFPGFKGGRHEEGTLLAIKRKKPTLLGGPNGNLEFVFVTYSQRGSHQDGPMHTYNKHVALASKDEKVLESLMKFLQKHITKGKVRRTIKRGNKKGASKKSPFTNKYTKISRIDCQKKNPKSREKTLKCLDDKKEQFKSLEKNSPKDTKDMKELQKTKNDYQKSVKKLIEKMKKDCIKYLGDKKKLKKCVEKEKKELESYDKDIPKIVMDDMRDNIQRMIDHTQKVDFGMFSDSKKGGAKKRTVKKSKKKGNNDSVYFEFDRFLGKGKFWRIVKNGSKITTHYGKIGTLGQMTTKDYGSKVDESFDSLIKSKKKKGYVEKEYYGHVSESNPKPPTKVEREYLRICKKAEQNKKINPMMRNLGCEDMLDQGESELIWQTQWYKDALKKGEIDWSSYEEHEKSNRKKKKSLRGGSSAPPEDKQCMSCGEKKGTIESTCGCGIIRKYCKECWVDWESGPLSEGNSKCQICSEKLRKGG